MLSNKTHLILIRIIQEWESSSIDTMLISFHISLPNSDGSKKYNKIDKVNHLLSNLEKEQKGPYSNSFSIDALKYCINEIHHKSKVKNIYGESEDIDEELLAKKNSDLYLSVKLDGYVIEGKEIIKMLSPEIQIETDDLSRLLCKFNFIIAKGHYEQGRKNHTNGDWASANAQFRTFSESLMIAIANYLLKNNNCNSFTQAVKLLSKTVNPPFLNEELNEVKHSKCETPFIEGFWKRLHPEGSHLGLSSEDDSTFRYHLISIFARYLLAKLEKRIS